MAHRNEVVEHLQNIGMNAEKKHGTKSVFVHQFIVYEAIPGGNELKVKLRSIIEKEKVVPFTTKRLVLATGIEIKIFVHLNLRFLESILLHR